MTEKQFMFARPTGSCTWMLYLELWELQAGIGEGSQGTRRLQVQRTDISEQKENSSIVGRSFFPLNTTSLGRDYMGVFTL